MPMNDFGVTFNPANSMDQAQRGGSGDPNANVQQAIRTLSLRLPSVVGARSIAPMDLLSGGGSANVMAPGGVQGGTNAMPFGIQQILEMLMGQGQQSETGKAQFGGTANPNFKFFAPEEPTPGSFTPIGEEDPNSPSYRKPTTQPIPNPGTLPPIGWQDSEPTYRKTVSKYAPTDKFME